MPIMRIIGKTPVFLGVVLGDGWAVFLWAFEFLCALAYARDTEELDILQPDRYIIAMADFVYYSKNALA